MKLMLVFDERQYPAEGVIKLRPKQIAFDGQSLQGVGFIGASSRYMCLSHGTQRLSTVSSSPMVQFLTFIGMLILLLAKSIIFPKVSTP
jgi:hypothetical protein